MNKATLINDYILSRIESGEYSPGDQIPTEGEFMELFDVSRMTVNKALSSLRAKGYLYSVRGKGTFIRRFPSKKKLNELTSFTEEMKARGMVPVTKTLEFTYTSVGFLEEKASMNLKEDDYIYKIIRLRYNDKTPIALDITILNEKVTGKFEYSQMRASLYEFLEKDLGLVIDYSVQRISAVKADPFIANHLMIKPGDPVLKISNITYDIQNRPIEVVHTYYVHDAYDFIQISTKEHQ